MLYFKCCTKPQARERQGKIMEFSYTAVKDTIRIDKVVSPRETVMIPEMIEGLPVTELGPYVLAESPVEELWLPARLKKIGAYGFYNCERLKMIHASSRTTDLGAGLFAGTSNVEFLDITVFEGEKSNLKELLSELRQTLRVRLNIREEIKAGEYEEKAQVRLIFPEYYEESVENTPARILYIETHGCGHRYRYCFAGTRFQYTGYDELFPHVKVQEKEAVVTELALGRLRYPWELSEKHRKMYVAYVREHWQTAGRLVLGADLQEGRIGKNPEAGGVAWLVEEILDREYTQENGSEIPKNQGDPPLDLKLQRLIDAAWQAGNTEAVSWLMDFRHRRRSLSGMQEEAQKEQGDQKEKRAQKEQRGQKEQRAQKERQPGQTPGRERQERKKPRRFEL